MQELWGKKVGLRQRRSPHGSLGIEEPHLPVRLLGRCFLDELLSLSFGFLSLLLGFALFLLEVLAVLDFESVKGPFFVLFAVGRSALFVKLAAVSIEEQVDQIGRILHDVYIVSHAEAIDHFDIVEADLQAPVGGFFEPLFAALVVTLVEQVVSDVLVVAEVDGRFVVAHILEE